MRLVLILQGTLLRTETQARHLQTRHNRAMITQNIHQLQLNRCSHHPLSPSPLYKPLNCHSFFLHHGSENIPDLPIHHRGFDIHFRRVRGPLAREIAFHRRATLSLLSGRRMLALLGQVGPFERDPGRQIDSYGADRQPLSRYLPGRVLRR